MNIKKGDIIENQNGIRKVVVSLLEDDIYVLKNETSKEITLEQIERTEIVGKKKNRKIERDKDGNIIETP